MLAVLQAHAALQEAATVSSGSVGPAASLPRYGLCLTTNPNCGRLGDVLAAIAASIVQPGGTQQGYVFDLGPEPPSAVPLVNSTGWRHAADLLRRMLVYNAPNVQTAANDRPCWGVHPAFLEGDCLFTLEWDAALPSMAVPALQRPGVLGIAPLPGSRVVMDRSVVAAGGNASSSGVDAVASAITDITRFQRAVQAQVAGFREARQNFTNGLRERLGYATDNDEHNCTKYVNTQWWRGAACSGARPFSSDDWAAEPERAHNGLQMATIVAIVAAVSAALLLVVGLVLWVLYQQKRGRRRDLLGRVLAPHVSPDTTLLITDVQNSTVLWEQLPVAVMDATLKLHHGTIRRMAAKFHGYESATEGDSFILAFTEPSSAVAFAAACQVELVLADWPPELLLHPDAAPVLVVPNEAEGGAAANLGVPACFADVGLYSRFLSRRNTGTAPARQQAYIKTPTTVVLPGGHLALVAYRGLRVRMGLHSGLDDPQHVAFNQVGSAFKYYGPFAETAKLEIDDAASGNGLIATGGVFIGRCMATDDDVDVEAQAALPTPSVTLAVSPIAAVSAPADASHSQPSPPPAGGEAGDDNEDAQPLYVAVHASLLCRLALSPPLRSVRVVELGSLAAPIGCITVAFMKVVGASTLLADLPGPASRALDQFARLACGLLGGAGGYLVEGGDGLLLAAFEAPPAAVEWALDCVEGLKRVEWEEELLIHEMCAVGLATGYATHMLTEASGRLSYRGRVMNRAARIAGIAAAGQVLCSGTVWEACGHQPGFGERVCGIPLGKVHLKGINSPVEVLQCFRK
ncbi:hypothetical protein GPECTOR_32g481 [Gonium pectorale]|uniref:Guanylate cyclase domain-containing protein n=1 Tax=Gonium pectorale TaxID=33097 RepID=A0A150GDH9_GONPE|nr:hypothetical protein GPECTOR_32g481 [Gonium pectorale]|eukprot:KXZ47868.1 hypothetical protein GPECTOR_32g481 [Gonium pectorale]